MQAGFNDNIGGVNNMHTDYHVHTDISVDCDTTAEEQIQAAVKKGLSEICFTEHLEIGFHRGEGWHSDLKAYKKQFERLQETIPAGFQIKLGIEAGVACSDENFGQLRKDLKTLDFDFVLAALHGINGTDIYQEEYYAGKDITKIYSEYLICLMEGMKKLGHEYYNAAAHIDFPAKGMSALGMGQSYMSYRDAPDELNEIFRMLIENGKCIEINTSTYRTTPADEKLVCDWIRRYVEMGGEYVTFGSDAHISSHVGLRFKDVVEIAKQSGVRYYATFDRMKPVMHRL